MRLISMVILTVLCFAIQARSEEKIVFNNPEQVYADLEEYKICVFEKSQLNELVDNQDKQIVLLKSGLDLCNDYNERLNSSILDLKTVINNQNTIQTTKPTSSIKTIGISLIIGFLLGTSLNLAY